MAQIPVWLIYRRCSCLPIKKLMHDKSLPENLSEKSCCSECYPVLNITLKCSYSTFRIGSKSPNSFPGRLKHRKALPKVKCIYPDKQTFAFRHDSPIWIEFDTHMNNASITKETVIVRSSASNKPVEGLIDAGSRMLMFRPFEDIQ